MTTQQSTTQTMKISDVKQQLTRMADEIDRQRIRIAVEKSGVPVAGIVPIDDLRRLERWDQEREEFFAALREFAEGFRDQTPEEIERETAKALAEVREEMRAERQEKVAQTS